MKWSSNPPPLNSENKFKKILKNALQIYSFLFPPSDSIYICVFWGVFWGGGMWVAGVWWGCYTFVLNIVGDNFPNPFLVINRPVEAGAVLQTPLSFINGLTDYLILFLKIFKTPSLAIRKS